MKIQRIHEVEATSICEAVDYLLSGGVGRYGKGELVLPKYAIGDAVRIEGYGAQDNLGVVTDVLLHDSEEHGENRAYTVRYLSEDGIMTSRDIYENRVGYVVLAARQGAMSVACRGDDEEMPDYIRPLGFLQALMQQCRKEPVFDLLTAGDDPVSAIEAIVEVEHLVASLVRLTGLNEVRPR